MAIIELRLMVILITIIRTPGNYNPNTGKVTGGNLDTYLKKYEKGGWTYPSQYKSSTDVTLPKLDYKDVDLPLTPNSSSSNKTSPKTTVRKSSTPQNLSQILAEIRALRQEIENLQKELDRLRNKPVKAIAV